MLSIIGTMLLLVTVLVAVAQGRREYKRLTTVVLATLQSNLEHGGAIRRFRLAAQSSGGQLRDVKVWVQEPNPNWVSHNFPGAALHFPYRLWRPDIGSEPDGCFINPRATEFFALLRWWISGTDGSVQIELHNQTFQVPPDPWVLPMKIEWSEGSIDLRVLILRNNNALEINLSDSAEEQQTHLLIRKSEWSRGDKWTAAGVIVALIAGIVSFFVPEIRRKLGLEKPAAPPIEVSKPESTKQTSPSSSVPPKLSPKVNQRENAKVVGKDRINGKKPSENADVAGNNKQVNSSPTSPLQINSAPNGIAIGGGTVLNPTVNNYSLPTKPDRAVSDADRMQIVAYLSQTKASISLKAPYGDKEATNYAVLWYGIFKDAHWDMKDRIVLAYMTVGGNPTPGAILYVKGEPGQPGEQITVPNAEPLAYVGTALKSQGLPISLQRDPKQDDGLIIIQFGPRPD